jgi:exodeoxyribonuclease VII large subunit
MEQYGTGDLQKQYEVLKLKLKERGLFDSERKKAMHTRYKHIGLITSQSGAALQDMISVFRNRLPITTLTLIPASVQGENAPSELISAIEHANKIASTVGIEALIVGRGGGSIEDLQAFNNEDLAFAIDASELPICSAVGHEIDFTIADLVADLRAPTPSAAAEMLSRDKDEYSISFEQYHNKLERLIEQYIKTKLISLNAFQQRLKQPRRKLSESAQQVDYFESQLIRLTTSRIKETRGILNGAQRNLLSNSPQQILKRISLQVSDIRRRFELISEVEINKRKINLAQLTRSLNGVSPLNTLARGYSITTIGEERVVRSTSNLNIGDQICTRLNRGRVISTIETIQNNSDTRKSK